MLLRHRPIGPAAVALLAAGLVLVPATPGSAAEGSAPTTADDHVTLWEGEAKLVDVLGNDGDPDGDDLAVCRVGKVADDLLVLPVNEDDPLSMIPIIATGEGQVAVVALGKPGTYEVTYYACDFDYLTPATLTVTVKKVPPLKVRVTKLANRPGKLKVTNRSAAPIRFLWGSARAAKPDGNVRIERNKRAVITTRRPSLIWVAVSPKTGAYAQGVVRNISLPPGVKALPPGAPKGPLTQTQTASRWGPTRS